ncbi:MAG: glycosyltransferase family 2 protein, partial [Patescibacteria group bacterium]|nr:glycosyltransferase family 2 protein [Patescibacteria group bacterium]
KGQENEDLIREKYFDVNFIPNKKNIGFLALVDKGLDVARGSFYLIINADIIIKAGTVEKIVDYIKENPSVGIMSPKMINFDNSIQPSCFRFYTPLTVIYRRTFLKKINFVKKHLSKFLMEDINKDESPIEVDWVMGSTMAISKKNLDVVGRMDKRFFMYFEDVDWCWRCWENDLKVIYNPRISVYHYHGAQSSNKSVLKAVLFNRYSRIHIASAIKFFLKHFGKKNPHEEYNKKIKKSNE